MEKRLKLLIFGATRHTGWHFVQQALNAGHEVTAVIRNPDLFKFQHPNLKVIKGDALQLSSFENEIAGKDAIISSLGIKPSDLRKPTLICSQGVANMIAGMKKNDVRRIMCISAIALDTNPQMGFIITVASRFLQWLLKTSYSDLRAMEAELKASQLDWTIIRPPKLDDKPGLGKYRIAVGNHLSYPWNINRADLADYLCKHITDESTYRQVVEVAY